MLPTDLVNPARMNPLRLRLYSSRVEVPVSDQDVIVNVDWTIEEARRQVDHQMTTASEIDGRSTALLGVLGGVAGLVGVFADLNLQTSSRVVATSIAVLAGIGSTVALAWSIWPQGGASYGAGVEGAVTMADELDTETFKRSQARSLRDAIKNNREYLSKRQWRLKLGTLLFALSVVAIIGMVAVGVFQPLPVPPGGA